MLEVIAINRYLKAALFSDGSLIAFAQMFDADGDETNSIEDAIVANVQSPAGDWIFLKMFMFDTPQAMH